MGSIINKHVIVTGYNIQPVHDRAISVFGSIVTPIFSSPLNSVQSFYIIPTGSKQGWDIDKKHDDDIYEFCNSVNTISLSCNIVILNVTEDQIDIHLTL